MEMSGQPVFHPYVGPYRIGDVIASGVFEDLVLVEFAAIDGREVPVLDWVPIILRSPEN
jgi:hypothetical protein